MTPPPAFSVVIPLFQKEATIGETLASALAQTLRDFEIVVVDDGSTDRGPQIVRSCGDRRVRLVVQPNAGVSAARNRGIRESTSPYLAFLDADDLWEPDFLAVMADLTVQFPEAGLYAAAYRVRDGRKNPLVRPPIEEGILADYFGAYVRGVNPVWISSAVVPRAVIESEGAFKEGVDYGEDTLFFGRIAARRPVAVSAHPSAIYRQDVGGRACHRPPVADARLAYAGPMEGILREIAGTGPRPPGLREYAFHLRALQARDRILAGQAAAGRRMLKACLRARLRPGRDLKLYLGSFVPMAWLKRKYRPGEGVKTGRRDPAGPPSP